MWEAISTTEIEPGQTLKFGDGDLEYEVLNVTRTPITNEVTSLVARRSTDGYTSQLALMLTAGIQPWRKYAAPLGSDEGLTVESGTPDAPSHLLDTLREAHQRGTGFGSLMAQLFPEGLTDEIRERVTARLDAAAAFVEDAANGFPKAEKRAVADAQNDAVKVELPSSETTDRVRDLLLGDTSKLSNTERGYEAVLAEDPSIDGTTADGTPLQHKTARQVLADAMLGKPMLSNGKPIGTIIETSVDEDGVRFVLQKNPDHPFPLLRSVAGIGIPPRGFDFNTTYGRMEPRIAYPGVSIHRDGGISVDGRGILTGVFGQGDGALYWQKTSAPAVKPEPTFTLTQLKSAVKKARKRARRSALREALGFIRNSHAFSGAHLGLLEAFFGKQAR